MKADTHEPAGASAAWLTVDLAALVANWQLPSRQVAPARSGVVVKADAYGLGAGPVVRALLAAGCREFFVALVDEGVRLLDDLGTGWPVDARLHVLHRALPGAEKECLARGLVPVLNSLDQPMRPVVRVLARLIQWREIAAGDAVGSNHTWTAQRPSRIATVSVGNADGYLRSASNRACLRLGGAVLPVVGRVSMDTVTVDATDVAVEQLLPGTALDVLDDVQDINALAAQAGTNAYQILTSLGARYRRQYLTL